MTPLMGRKAGAFLFIATVFLTGSACTKEAAPISDAPVVSNVELADAGLRHGVNGDVPTVSVEITLDKAAIAELEFLYGADLQYSTTYDSGFDLYLQVLPIGHIPARFRIVGDELQLVTDNKRLFFSDINHPEMIVTRFKILSQDAQTITVKNSNSASLLGKIYQGQAGGNTNGDFLDPKGPMPKDLYVRSFKFDPKGNYILQETSIEMPDGNIAEFMESIFPRKNLEPGPNFEKFQMLAEDPIGGTEGPVARFRFLKGEKLLKVIDGEEMKIAFAQHYDLSPNADGTPGTIDWYVTANAPDDVLPALKDGVEGWNRYFRNEQGIHRDVMRFMGRLPEGIKIGDPRYNVVSWDSRRVAGAAYESQASDPETGKQSHSLIYLPAAWLDIGDKYWKDGSYTDAKDGINSIERERLSALAHSRIACLKNMGASFRDMNLAGLSHDEIDVFAHDLLRQTLFHEVGHALGLDHNFKGSLSYDRENPKSLFSTSIMDYNHFEIERAAFSATGSSDGPQLEYDRQAIDALYDKGHDIKDSDSIVAVCNDAEADNEVGGVDPLCVRYDVEKDPTASIVRAFERVNLAALPHDQTLSESLKSVVRVELSDAKVAAASSQSDLDLLIANVVGGIKGTLQFYFLTGRASINGTLRVNMHSLKVYEDSILPAGFDADLMRDRIFEGAQTVVNMKDLPSMVTTAIKEVTLAAQAQIASTPALRAFAQADRDKALKGLQDQIQGVVDTFKTTGLTRLRSGVLGNMTRGKAPYFFGPTTAGPKDYEAELTLILSGVVLEPSRSQSERVAAATALISYRNRDLGDQKLSEAVDTLKVERKNAKDSASREAAQQILTILLSTT